ncbi:MAG: hypothetical protein H6657_27605 [Ardenticatenaceae bacterium]|nr:hypothetical protein [Ardenticatenaceae bacterium]
MRELNNSLYSLWAFLLLLVILMGSPLASFGCQTVAPDQFKMSCDPNLPETAVQNNAAQPAAPPQVLDTVHLLICTLFPIEQFPQEVHRQPPYPPPRIHI